MAIYQMNGNPAISLRLVDGVIAEIREYRNEVSYPLPYLESHMDWCFRGNAPSISQLLDNFYHLVSEEYGHIEKDRVNAMYKAVMGQEAWDEEGERLFYFKNLYNIPILLVAIDNPIEKEFTIEQVGVPGQVWARISKTHSLTFTRLDEAFSSIAHELAYDARKSILLRDNKRAKDRLDSAIAYVPTLHDKLYDHDQEPPNIRLLEDEWWETCEAIMKHDLHKTHIKSADCERWDTMAVTRAHQRPGRPIRAGVGMLTMYYYYVIGKYRFCIYPHVKSNGITFSYTLCLDKHETSRYVAGRIDVFETLEHALEYANDFASIYQ